HALKLFAMLRFEHPLVSARFLFLQSQHQWLQLLFEVLRFSFLQTLCPSLIFLSHSLPNLVDLVVITIKITVIITKLHRQDTPDNIDQANTSAIIHIDGSNQAK